MPATTDLLFTPEDFQAEADFIPNAKYLRTPSIWGHRAGNPGAVSLACSQLFVGHRRNALFLLGYALAARETRKKEATAFLAFKKFDTAWSNEHKKVEKTLR